MIALRTLRRLLRGAWFLVWFFYELTYANAIVAWEVVTPTHYMRPGVIRCPIRVRSSLEVTLLANLISLTPGTLTLDVSPDRRYLYVHGLHIRSPDALRAQVKRFEDKLLRVLR